VNICKSRHSRRSLGFLSFLVIVQLILGCASQQSATPFIQSMQGPVLLAHRGVHQTYDTSKIERDTCTAQHIYSPTHGFLENTLASMQAAFDYGADLVEFDIHPTIDGEFAVFHDWTLDCRTEGHGVTREQSYSYLKTLDVGYGYTVDGGKTFPFRGKGVGLMPTLTEVLNTFPNRHFLINIKSNDTQEGVLLANYLNKLPARQRHLLAVYGAETPVAVVRERVLDVITMSKQSVKSCAIRYMLMGWLGVIPQSCERSLIALPINKAGWMWGWPDRFIDRMQNVGSAVFVVGQKGEGATGGIDSIETLATLPASYRGGIWTNRIELIGKVARKQYNK